MQNDIVSKAAAIPADNILLSHNYMTFVSADLTTNGVIDFVQTTYDKILC